MVFCYLYRSSFVTLKVSLGRLPNTTRRLASVHENYQKRRNCFLKLDGPPKKKIWTYLLVTSGSLFVGKIFEKYLLRM